MKHIGLWFGTAALVLANCGTPALADNSGYQELPGGCGTGAPPSGQISPGTQDSTGKNCVNATVSASVGGFQPSSSGARMTPITVTTSDSSGPLPTGAVVVVSNTGSNPIYANVNGVAATTSDQLIEAGSWFAFTIPSGVTTLHAIATGGSSTANGVGGSGLPTGAGGGSGGGGGGGGAVTAVSGAYALGSIVDIGTGSSPAANTVNARLATLATNQNSTAAGTSASNAQAVQGVTGGVNIGVACNSGCSAGTPSTVVTNSLASGVVASQVICSASCHLTAWHVAADTTLSSAAYFIFLIPATTDPGNGAPPAGTLCYPQSAGIVAPGASAILETWSSGLVIDVGTGNCTSITESTHAYNIHGDKY